MADGPRAASVPQGRVGRGRWSRRALSVAIVGAAAVLVLVASAALSARSAPDAGPDASAADAATDAATATSSPARPMIAGEPTVDDPAPVPVTVVRAEPSRLVVDALGLSAEVQPVALAADGTLDPPEDPQRVGWFAPSSRPGELGRSVLVGHLDSRSGGAVFARLGQLVPGDVISVEGADGVLSRFAVTAVSTVPKDAFPTEAVYGATPDAELSLITCAGPYDRANGGYQDNVVVSARAIA